MERVPKHILLFDHPTFFNHSMINHLLGTNTIRFVMNENMVAIWPFNRIAVSMDSIPASFQTIHYVFHSSMNTKAICIAPRIGRHGKFHTTAFRISNHVVPLIICYDPEEDCDLLGRPESTLTNLILQFLSNRRQVVAVSRRLDSIERKEVEK